jgi:hypothetical protein
VAAPVVEESPTTDTALPPAVTGAVTGAVTWLPPAAESAPDVVSPAAPPEPAEPPEPAVAVEPEDDESPSTDTALPLTVTGAETATVAWLPPPAESAPEVLPVVTVGAGAAGAVACDPDESESPTTEMELPVTVTGTTTETAAWLPPRALSAPEVPSSADACPAKNRMPPPTTRATSSPLRTYECMVFPS